MENENNMTKTPQPAFTEEDKPLVLDFVGESTEHIETAESALLEIENNPEDQELINKVFRGFHTIKGLAGFLNLSDINKLAHSAENLLDRARKAEITLCGEYSDLAFESLDMLKQMIEDTKASAEQQTPLQSPENHSQLLKKLKKSVESDTDTPQAASQKQQTEETAETDRRTGLDRRQKDDPDYKGPERRKNPDRRMQSSDKIKVSTERLDNLINMVGELVIAQLMVSEQLNQQSAGVSQQLTQKVNHQSKIVRNLQELSMSMRMVPIKGLFQRMTRVIRDLSRKSGKDINFITSGEETELDRSLIEKLADPLVHMVRNSVDHGIESSEKRKTNGKSETGNVNLRAYHQAGNIVIELEDDGKGLDKEKILDKAIKNGVVTADQNLSDSEIHKLIFHPGLSTAEKITDVSGRGVGMDVVRKNIEALRGKIDITSKKGEGTKFTISLPLTLAIIDGQIIKVGNQRYIVPINSIVHSFKPVENQISTVQGKVEMVRTGDDLLGVLRLHKLFKITGAVENPTEAILMRVQDDDKSCCLLIDELLGQQQVVIKNLGGSLTKTKGISGAAIMGDGKVSLILDIPGLTELAQNSQ
jgi:two-component system chemotaxis sensor kinase CheA